MNEHPTADAAPDLAGASLPRPWGFWSTLGFALLAFLLANGAVGVAAAWRSPIPAQESALSEALEDPAIPLLLVLISVIQIAILAGAARFAGWPVGRYFGFTMPTRRDVVVSFSALVAMMIALELLTWLSGRASVTPFQTGAYRAAKEAGTLPVMWLAFVVAAPIAEEILFRGFVFRGWAASPLGTLILGIVFKILTKSSRRASAAPSGTDAYRAAAKTAGTLPMLRLFIVVTTPVGEEIELRRFVLRGWTASELSAVGTIALTSVIFALIHIQYDWFGIFQILCLSGLFGWVRWRSGSTTLTILLHMAINFISTLWAAAKVEGLV